MGTRAGAIGRALEFFDGNGFRDRLAELVAIPSTSQDPGHEADVQRYLDGAIRPWLERMGFAVAIHPNPQPGFGPILTAERLEDPGRPTILTYGHGDTVRGLEDQWRDGLDPWRLTEEADRWYGRGTADNKGQHAVNLSRAGGGARGARRQTRLQPEAGAGDLRGTRLGRPARLRRRAQGRTRRRRADRQRRSARDARGADHRHRHARHLPFRPRRRPASGRRAFRPLGRADHRSRGGADPRARHHHRSPRPASWCATGCRGTACRPACARCWPAARSAVAARRRRSIPAGASRD